MDDDKIGLTTDDRCSSHDGSSTMNELTVAFIPDNGVWIQGFFWEMMFKADLTRNMCYRPI